MRRRRKKREEAKATLEMTPMIDVVFNLLIFFLCSPFKIPEGQLDAFLPKGVQSPTPPAPIEKVLIGLRGGAGGTIPRLVIGRNKFVDANGQPDFDDLAMELVERREKAREIDPDTPLPVEIDSDDGVRYRYVVGDLNACTKARIEDIRFTLHIGKSSNPP